MESEKSTTIRVSVKVREELGELGTVKDSYNSIIGMLLNFYKENKGDKSG